MSWLARVRALFSSRGHFFADFLAMVSQILRALALLLVSCSRFVLALNANGHFCVPCAVLMEETYRQTEVHIKKMAEATEAGRERTVTVDFTVMMNRACDPPDRRWRYAGWLRDRCGEIAGMNAAAMSEVYSGDAPTRADVFNATARACVEMQDLCDADAVAAVRQMGEAKRKRLRCVRRSRRRTIRCEYITPHV